MDNFETDGERKPPLWLPFLWRTLEGLTAVGLATIVLFHLHLNLAAAGFLQILVILGIALRGGFWAATIASVLANSCLNYYFTAPLFRFTIDDPQNWIALLTFEGSALLVSQLSAKAHQQARRAGRNRRDLEQLYHVSRHLLLLSRESSPGMQIATLIKEAFSAEAVVVFDGQAHSLSAAGERDSQLESEVRGACLLGESVTSSDLRTKIRLLPSGTQALGALAVRGSSIKEVTVDALATLAAMALERESLFERESQSHAEKQTERLRTAVLDALAHEFKNPLTVIHTAAGGLLEPGGLSETQRDLALLIDEQSTRLNLLTHRLLKTARLDGEELRLRPQQTDLGELVQNALKDAAGPLSGHAIEMHGLELPLLVQVDRELMTRALVQLLDNAGKYSHPLSPVTITARASAREVRLEVRSVGSAIPVEESEMIFRRFYRSPTTRERATGTGLGLAVSRRIAEAHGGGTWMASEKENCNTFVLTVPFAQEQGVGVGGPTYSDHR